MIYGDCLWPYVTRDDTQACANQICSSVFLSFLMKYTRWVTSVAHVYSSRLDQLQFKAQLLFLGIEIFTFPVPVLADYGSRPW